MADLSNNSKVHTLRDLKLRELAMLEKEGYGDDILANQLRAELWPDPADRPARPRPVRVVGMMGKINPAVKK